MNKNLPLLGVVLVWVTVAGCAGKPQPSVSPVGSWAGTLTGSDLIDQLFVAEISETIIEDVFSGVFTVQDKVFSVTGYYDGSNDGGDTFIFGNPADDIRPTASPPTYPGTRWTGTMTRTSYVGQWEFNETTEPNTSLRGEFTLERTR